MHFFLLLGVPCFTVTPGVCAWTYSFHSVREWERNHMFLVLTRFIPLSFVTHSMLCLLRSRFLMQFCVSLEWDVVIIHELNCKQQTHTKINESFTRFRNEFWVSLSSIIGEMREKIESSQVSAASKIPLKLKMRIKFLRTTHFSCSLLIARVSFTFASLASWSCA